ncbi:MAG: type II 3-dehydroquinate dehydratase, partial [Bacillota bacterium]
MKFLVINGPNLNLLGTREPDIYGSNSHGALTESIQKSASDENVKVKTVQSNHEGTIVDIIQKAAKKYDGIIINPAAYTHTSIAI